ncbi:hypothetical protein MNEG_1170 [Monoraphidium neglectum]|uniref:Uncharacterized protein n=1 Tax=Monoraphidium neglectum TaxID=145388 RepID=A0A0D2MW40_9CHLO|nr:hypothetical protein MNEG_1170 [Monoraphidium neglectum]KIZ06780.1 hypothetical protein MNEG_1170 [Monoraphidium neglectum]|eukprot:XP_013905799.1 hypothetical protein MNEG_1170 [Monoraphidium neglectum]
MFSLEGLDRTLSILLFTDVTNSKEIQEKVIKAQIEPEFAFVNAAAVLGLLPLRLAAHKAATYDRRGRLVCKSLHAELVFNLSGSKHVSG